MPRLIRLVSQAAQPVQSANAKERRRTRPDSSSKLTTTPMSDIRRASIPVHRCIEDVFSPRYPDGRRDMPRIRCTASRTLPGRKAVDHRRRGDLQVAASSSLHRQFARIVQGRMNSLPLPERVISWRCDIVPTLSLRSRPLMAM